MLALAGAAQAATITVTRTDDPSGSGSCPADCSLRQAVAFAGSGDTIQLAGTSGSPAVYTLTQGSPIVVGQSLTIAGNGVAATTVDGSANQIDANHPLNRILKVTAGTLTITGVTFTGGDDGNDENFTGCSPCNTLSANGGGALFNSGATVNLNGVAFNSNGGSPLGGAVANAGTLNMTDVSFLSDGAAFGGGLFSHSGTVTGSGVTFENDGGFDFGGGAVFLAGGTAMLANATIVGSGTASSRAGGIENAGATLTLTNDTLSGNLRGSLETDTGASTTVQNTILGSGFSDGVDFDCVASGKSTSAGTTTANAITVDGGNNIDQDNACGLTGLTDQVGVDPKLAPIANNGGPTRTQALLHGSPAIDAGNDGACPATDQRGTSRPQGVHCDIGAFEAVILGQPTASTDAASGLTPFDATLNATINLAGEAGGFHFLWGTSPGSLTNQTPEVGAGVVSADTPASEDLPGLSAGTTYYFQAVADNASGTATASNVLSFTTPPGPPVVSNVSVDGITDTTATVHVTIDPAGADTTYVIKYGPDTSYGQSTAAVDLGSTAGPQQLTQTLTGLNPNSTYHFDVVATNSQAPSGVDSGDQQFTTEQQVAGTAGSPVTFNGSGNSGQSSSSCITATIDWGDGTAPSMVPTTCQDDGFDGQNFQFSAMHTYAAAGHFPIHVTYSDSGTPLDAFALISPAPPHTLSVSLPGSGSGTVTGSGISCPGTCSHSYAAGTVVTLTATPASGSTFDGWGGACHGTGACDVTMGSDQSVTATFTSAPATVTPAPATVTPAPHALSVSLGGSGSGKVTGSGISCPGTCAHSYAAGTVVALTATPAAGSTFTGWGGACSGTGACNVTMDSDKHVTATFAAPLPLACSGRPIVLLDVHRAGAHVIVAGLALSKYAGHVVTITTSVRKAKGGSATVQSDGTFQASLPAPPRNARNIRYQSSVDGQRSLALKLSRQLVIVSEKATPRGLLVSLRLTGGHRGQLVTISRQLSCTASSTFAKVRVGPGGRIAASLPRPPGAGSLAFYRATTTVGRFPTASLPITLRAAT